MTSPLERVAASVHAHRDRAVAIGMLLCLTVAVLLGGCSQPADSGVMPHGQVPGGLNEFRLSDGTRCVGLYQRAISCDWTRASEARP